MDSHVPRSLSHAHPALHHFHHVPPQAVKRGQAGNGTDSGAAAPGGGMNGGELGRSDSMLQMPLTASMSYRWLEDAVTEWQTSQVGLFVFLYVTPQYPYWCQ